MLCRAKVFTALFLVDSFICYSQLYLFLSFDTNVSTQLVHLYNRYDLRSTIPVFMGAIT